MGMEVVEAPFPSTVALAPLGMDACLEECDLCRPDSISPRLDGLGLSTSRSVAYPD